MGLWPLVSSGYGKPMFARVTTMDADLDRITIEPQWKGRDLFDTVCRIIGLREIWFFGLQFNNKKRIPCWLQMDKKIAKQDISKSDDGTLQFLFIVKFYPEDVEEELIQDLTRHLFFVQLKGAILSGVLHCPAEASVLLASYALQAIHGDCISDMELDLDKLLPGEVINQFDMSKEMWSERIQRWWHNNQGQSREDAEMEYLRVAQDLEMYGIQYYPIRNKRENDLLLGVSATGIGVYEGNNRVTPRPFFSWNEIKNIHFKNKKFYMNTVDKVDISFQAQDSSINMSIMDLCIGTHNLYLRRRQPDPLEMQQMRAQSNEQRIRRRQEQERLANERDNRKAVEEERDRLRDALVVKDRELENAQDSVRDTQDQLRSLNERARASESNLQLQLQRADDAERECARFRHVQSKSWSSQLGLPVGVPLQGALSYHQLMMSSSSAGEVLAPPHPDMNANHFQSAQTLPMAAFMHAMQQQQAPPPPDPVSQYVNHPDIRMIQQELEHSRREYNERTRTFKTKLAEFRAEIEGLKRDDRPPTENDAAHAHNVASGCMDRLSTLRMIPKSKSVSSIAEFAQYYYH